MNKGRAQNRFSHSKAEELPERKKHNDYKSRKIRWGRREIQLDVEIFVDFIAKYLNPDPGLSSRESVIAKAPPSSYWRPQ